MTEGGLPGSGIECRDRASRQSRSSSAGLLRERLRPCLGDQGFVSSALSGLNGLRVSLPWTVSSSGARDERLNLLWRPHDSPVAYFHGHFRQSNLIAAVMKRVPRIDTCTGLDPTDRDMSLIRSRQKRPRGCDRLRIRDRHTQFRMGLIPEFEDYDGSGMIWWTPRRKQRKQQDGAGDPRRERDSA
jgi:hypothetical protein